MNHPPFKLGKIKIHPETRLRSVPQQGSIIHFSLFDVGKLKIVQQKIIQHYQRRRFVSLLQGLYSCLWKRYQWRPIELGTCCCTKKEQLFSLVLLATFCLSFLLLYMWLETKNDYASFDEYVYNLTNYWFYWSHFLVVTASVMFTYIVLLMMIAICLLTEGQELQLHWCNKACTLLILSICIISMVAVTKFYEEKWKAAELSLQMTGPFLHIFGICMMVVFSWPIALYYAQLNRTVIQFISVSSFLAVLLIILMIPLGIQSPCIRENRTLGPKPTFIGHRGAPTLAPENTLMSFEKAIEQGATGLETDVTLSYDGVPFLMHDHTLKRTTNIKEIMPNFSDLHASMFTWQTLKTLNSGRWFLKNKPFRDMAPLTKEDEEMAKSQSIMKLSNFLRLADKENKLVIFDLYRPPKKHPYRYTWLVRVLEVMMKEVGIKSHLVLWLPGQFREFVSLVAPAYKQVVGRKFPLHELLKRRIKGLNLAYKDIDSKDIKEFEKYGIFTNIYVINEPWLYSLAWCAGVHSVTTNTIQVLKKVKRPFFFMTPTEYMKKWILLDSISAFIIVVVFFFHWWREKGWSELPENSSTVFPMSDDPDIEEDIERYGDQDETSGNLEELSLSSPSDKSTGVYWDSYLEKEPLFSTTWISEMDQQIDELQSQDENIENQEEMPGSTITSDKSTGPYWESLSEMQSSNKESEIGTFLGSIEGMSLREFDWPVTQEENESSKITRSLSTESVMGSSDEDMRGNVYPTGLSKDNVKGSSEEEVLEVPSLNLGNSNNSTSQEKFLKPSALSSFC